MAAVSHRWQYSDRHFIDDVEQTQRLKEGSEVINDVHLVDISVSYSITKRFTAILAIPFQFATRSQAVRDNRRDAEGNLINPSPFPSPKGEVSGAVIDRYETSAYGLSDIRVLATAWLLDPDNNKRQNVSVGLGVLFPTGEKDAKDTFTVAAFAPDGTYQPQAEERNVDNSIQPGSGAFGFMLDIYGFAELFEDFNVFAAGTYIATPAEDAGVKDRPGPDARIWSVADSYLVRAGMGYTFRPGLVEGITLTFGGRMEGSPSTDIFGSSEGRRRPGFAISVEPGLVATKNGWFASFSAPVAVHRHRERDFADDEGDAAFADFMTLLSVGRRF
jgi:hypothetical protein